MKKIDFRSKIVSKTDLKSKLETIKAQKLSVVQCHGVFDLLHLGHILHFEEASNYGDILIVTVTSDEYVGKGLGRPEFTDLSRAEMIAAIYCVDLVCVNFAETASEIIQIIKPNIYFKGPDYSSKLSTDSNLVQEKNLVEKFGGKLIITENQTYSSSNLLNQYSSKISDNVKEKLQEIKKSFGINDVLYYLDQIKKIKVLVIGETIIDEYQYGDTIGKSSKSPTLAIKINSIKKSLGGALAISNNLSNFVTEVNTITGYSSDKNTIEFINEKLEKTINVIPIIYENRPTILKRRLVDEYFFHKLIEVYEMDDSPSTQSEEELIIKNLESIIDQIDLVIVADFGHGLITHEIVKKIQETNKFLAINTQMNAGNKGFNTISKYKKADFISLTESELRLDQKFFYGEIDSIADEVGKNTNTKDLAITKGNKGCEIFNFRGDNVKKANFPALISDDNVVDRVGAGDSFFAITALLSYVNAPVEVIGFIGNIAGAMSTTIISNEKSIKFSDIYKTVQTLLK